MNPTLKKYTIQSFTFWIIVSIIIATIFPPKGEWKGFFEKLTVAAIALLFFLHGAKLSREAILQGLGHWRLHILVFSSTYLLFPALGLLMGLIPRSIMSEEIYKGFIYLSVLPATVQSAIAYTSIARGNVAAAICSASGSSLLGVFISPLYVSLLLSAQGEIHFVEATLKIFLQLLVPFFVGHLVRPRILWFIEKHKGIVNVADQSSILLVVYTAFGAAVLEGIWTRFQIKEFVLITVLSLILLFVVLGINLFLARFFKFNKKDEITILFCASKKSLANGVPMANVLFPVSVIGVMLLPLMIFHQLQLMICAWIAEWYAKRPEDDEDAQHGGNGGNGGKNKGEDKIEAKA